MGYIWDYKPLTKWGCTSKIIQVDQNWRPKERHFLSRHWNRESVTFLGFFDIDPNDPKSNHVQWDYDQWPSLNKPAEVDLHSM